MFGVLVAASVNGETRVLRAFSGLLDNRWDIDGCAPPIFDRSAREKIEHEGYPLVARLNVLCEALNNEPAFVALRSALRDLNAERAAQVPASEKRERKKASQAFAAKRAVFEAALAPRQRLLKAAERLRAVASRDLMRRIFDTYNIANARGERQALRQIFTPQEPPSGAGDCAAPKLLAEAYRQKLTPLALAEFFWGSPPLAGGRVQGAFYPACKNRCGPLLPFMLQGLEVGAPRKFAPPALPPDDLRIVFEDQWIVIVDKPVGLLSVPGKSDADSILAKLKKRYPQATGPLLVHRLDMDTSGLLLAAKDKATHAALQKQFAEHSIEKTYVALLEGLISEDEGQIELPMRVDIDDRPRQIHDPAAKPASTRWRVVGREAGRTRVEFFPFTGRTHQLRVHAAHAAGLNAPIVGDRLYGHESERLLLHAESLTFTHPATLQAVHVTSPAPF